MSLCNLCPRQCNTDRSTPQGIKRSLCHAPETVKLALVSLHAWEEPCLCGTHGAGTVFFSHCNLRCCFCQNHEISAQGKGFCVDTERLTAIFLEQQDRGAACLELVTPGHYTDQIIPALEQAKARGLTLPVVYNSNGYDRPETLLRLRGLVDVFLPDLKYFDSIWGQKYSGVPRYFEVASRAIETMAELTGPAVLDAQGQLRSGVLVRHLVLPGLYQDSCRCLQWLHERFGDTIILSIMNQYMPMYKACRHPQINRPLLTLEYQKVVRFARSIGISRAYIQEGKTVQAKFIPCFDGSHVFAAPPAPPAHDHPID